MTAGISSLPRRCRRTKLRKPHGLRKAVLRRLAERGGSTKEIAAVSGHKSLIEIERYTARADQRRLSKAAMRKLSDGNENESV